MDILRRSHPEERSLCLGTPGFRLILDQIKRKNNTKLCILNIEFRTIQIHEAVAMGVSKDRIEEMQNKDQERHQLLMVSRTDPDYTGGLRKRDILLNLKFIALIPWKTIEHLIYY